MADPEKDKMFSINKLQSDSSVKVHMFLENIPTLAVIDTAADVTVVSNSFFKELKEIPKFITNIKMHAAGENQILEAKQFGPVKLTIGKQTISHDIFVAPIHDDILLGIDILRKLEAKIDLGQNQLTLKNDILPLQQSSKINSSCKQCKLIEDNEPENVILLEKLIIPGKSEMVQTIPCKVKHIQSSFLETNPNLPILTASAIFKCLNSPIVSMINDTEFPITLPKGTIIGTLHPIKEEDIFKFEEPNVRQTTTLPSHSSTELPKKCEKMFNEAGSEDFKSQDKDKLKQLLIEFEECFAQNEYDLGSFTQIEHKIDTGTSSPIKLPLRKTPFHFRAEEEELLQKMLDAKVIEPSNSAWAAAPVLIRKKDKSVRWCLDYRELNKITKKDVFPLPHISECMDSLEGNWWFSKLDAQSAYWQIPVAENDKEKTAFRTRQGLWQFSKLPFGMVNAPSTFSRAMNLVLKGLTWTTTLAFLDDVLVLGKTTEEHLNNLKNVLQRFKQFGLRFKPDKCSLFKKEVMFLGRKVNRQGVSVTDESIEVMQNWKEPTNKKEIQCFLGFANFHRSFIKNFSEIAEPLNRLLSKNQEFEWKEPQKEAFEKLKSALSSPPVLTTPCETGTFILDTDASDFAIGAELLQIQNGQERTIAYGSVSLTPYQKNYCTTRKELIAVVKFCNFFKHYLLGKSFICRTDHHSLIWLRSFKNVEGILARWLEELTKFNMEIEHRPGRLHGNADALSRIQEEQCPHYKPNQEILNLPCGGCKYCKKATQNWSTFEEEINDVEELSTTRIQKLTKDDTELIKTGIDISFEFPTPKIYNVSLMEDPPIPKEINMEKAQEEDEDLSLLYQWLKTKKEPEEKDVAIASPKQRFYYINRNLFFMANDKIYKKGEELRDLLVIPNSVKKDILELCHDIPSAGHQGIQRTKERIKRSYSWYKLKQDVENHISQCAQCNKCKSANRKNKYPMKQNHAGAPLQKVHIDFIGPLPMSNSGNKHILIICDNFTKWCECFALPHQGTELMAKTLINQFFTRFGYPLDLISDQGSNFDSILFKEICKMLQIHKKRTTAYRPSSNGQAERVNRGLLAAIRCYVDKHQKDWDEYLPQITAAMRSAVNRSTGFSANALMLGREINTPAEFLHPFSQEKPKGEEEYVRSFREAMQETHSEVRKTLKVQLKRAKDYYDIKSRIQQFNTGDAVYSLDNARKNKLVKLWKGPSIITTCLSPCLSVVLSENRTEKVIHHDYLKPCHSPLPEWIIKKKKTLLKQNKEVFCICRSPDDGRLMIQCQLCLEWFHHHCIGFTQAKAKSIKIFHCNSCKQPT